MDAAKTVGDRINGHDVPNVFAMAFVDESVFDSAVDVFETYDDQGLSFTEATTSAR